MEDNKRYHNCGTPSCKKPNGLPGIGIFFIGLGLAFLLVRLNVIPYQYHEIIISWQALLIFIGTINIFRNHARFPGFIMVLIGTAFLLPEIVHIPFHTSQIIWPLIFIVVGVIIVVKTRFIKAPHFFSAKHHSATTSDKIEEVAIFGGGKRVITDKNLKGGNIAAIFGGLEIDLSDAEIQEDTIVIEVAAIFGGVQLIVKPEWDVQVQVASILGGFNDKRKMYKNDSKQDAKRLIIKGAAIFGGGEVKSY